MLTVRFFIVVAVLVAMPLLYPGVPLRAADCGFNLPCEDTSNDPDHSLQISNNGGGTSIVGISSPGNGILGASSGGENRAGVVGSGNGLATGVTGGSSAGTGVLGTGFKDGVKGRTSNKDYSGVFGINESAVSGGVGVRGQSDKGEGVFGIGQKGVHGKTSDSLGTGVVGEGMIGVEGKVDSALSPVLGAGVVGNASGGAGIVGVKGNHTGTGVAVEGVSTNGISGRFSIFRATNSNPALRASTGGTGNAAYFDVSNAASAADGLKVQTAGTGKAGYFQITNEANDKAALRAETKGTGWAGSFIATGAASRGVYIQTAGGQGLQVEGGTKEAVVPTSQGNRSLYAEESSEVYFTDYGFGKLKDGKAVIPVDPLFGETVNLNQPYHVFVQAYGKAELYVSKRAGDSFEVSLNTGDPQVEFSYRLVGKRRGFEQARLEAAPGVNPKAGLEKAGEKVAVNK